MDIQLLHITQLLLDTENPRHDIITSQRDIIKQLLATEKVENLARDISEQGSLSPLETIGVLPFNGDNEYVVVEGNRRVCACLLLNDPSLSPTEIIRKNFQTLKRKNNVPNELRCIIFQSRDDADHWIQLKHEGQLDGRGTKRWDAPQITRYAEKRGRKNPNIQAKKLLDFAIEQEIISADESGNHSITTLQRYLSNPIFRNVLGLENREDLQSGHDLETFKKLVTRFLNDAMDGHEVNSRSKGKDWIAYANKLQHEISAPPPPSNPLTDFGYSKSEKTTLISLKPPSKQSKTDPTKRKNLISHNVKFPINDKILNKIYLEMRKLEVEGHEFSVAYLIKAFIEGTIILYMKTYLPGELKKESKLHDIIKHVSAHLEQSGVRKGKLQSLNLAGSDMNSMMSPFIIGAMVHLSVIPTKRELLNIWDRLEEILLEIHERLA
jgi:hypothetical protein